MISPVTYIAMKIFFIHSRYSHFGGGEQYVSSLRVLLEKNGHSVYLFAFDEETSLKNPDNFIFRDRFSIHERNPLVLWLRYMLRFFFHPLVWIRLRRWIREIEPDIIHIHANDRYGISVLLGIAGLGIPIVQTIHANDSICLSRTFKKSDREFCQDALSLSCLTHKCISADIFFSMAPSYLIRNFLARRIVDRFVAPNKFLKARLESNGFHPVEFMPLFVESHEHYSDRYTGGLIFAPGTHLETKGFQYLIRAMNRIIGCNREAELHISGTGPYSEQLMRLTRDLGLEKKVVFHGYLNKESLDGLYKSSNVVVFPSLFLEVCPLVVLEAMSFGKPVIAGKYSGIDDMLEQDSGCLVDPGNPSDIAEAVCNILNNPGRAAGMGQNGYRRFNELYSPDGHYRQVISLYQSLVRTDSRSGPDHAPMGTLS